jgi:hypothetical protein
MNRQKDLVEWRYIPVETARRGRLAGVMMDAPHRGRIAMPHLTKFLGLALIAASLAPANAAPKKAADDQTKYCVQVEPSTGSRIVTTECRTKAEWANIGVDVDELAKK